jgi:hypothetical protein
LRALNSDFLRNRLDFDFLPLHQVWSWNGSSQAITQGVGLPRPRVEKDKSKYNATGNNERPAAGWRCGWAGAEDSEGFPPDF